VRLARPTRPLAVHGGERQDEASPPLGAWLGVAVTPAPRVTCSARASRVHRPSGCRGHRD
jgi:hypothetical protein